MVGPLRSSGLVLIGALLFANVAQRSEPRTEALARVGSDLLALAVEEGDGWATAALLRLGVDPSGRPESGIPPLITALDRGRLDLAEQLLRAGADPNATSRDGRAPLVRAVQGVRWGHDRAYGAVSLLLRHGADPNLVHDGWTALHTAVAAGDEALAALLLAHGADPNRRSPDGRTPLRLARDLEEDEVARRLLWSGAAGDDGRMAVPVQAARTGRAAEHAPIHDPCPERGRSW